MTKLHGTDLGSFGIYTFGFEHQRAAQIRESIQELEEQGWRSLWFPEVGGREALTLAGFLLASTRRMHIVNGIAQISAREPRQAFGASLLLADAYPGRHVLGLGVGRSRPGVKPLAAMAGYLDELDALSSSHAGPHPPVHRILAAYGPRMLELARDRAAGAHTYHVSVAHTASARHILGPDAFLGVEQPVLFEAGPDKARAIARKHLSVYLDPGNTYNLAKFRRLGYCERDISNGGSDRFIDEMVFWGEPSAIARRLNAHVEAGADHVAIQVIGIGPGQSAMPYWRTLADALLPQGAGADS